MIGSSGEVVSVDSEAGAWMVLVLAHFSQIVSSLVVRAVCSTGAHRAHASSSSSSSSRNEWLLGHVGLRSSPTNITITTICICGGGSSRLFNVVVRPSWLPGCFWFVIVGRFMPERSEDALHKGLLAEFVGENAECKESKEDY